MYAIWEVNTTTSASVTFPAIAKTTVRAYTQTAGSSRIFQTSQQTEYSGYNAYTSCTIDGVDVTGTYFVTVKENSALLNSTIYRAKFTDGTLYVETVAQGTGTNTTTSMSLTASAYSTTAIFSGGASVTVLDRKLASSNPSFTNSSAGETITLAGYPQSIDFVISSGNQTSAYYTWNGGTQQSGNNTIFDYDDLYDYNDSLLRVYYVDYERISSYQGEDQFIDAGIEPIFKLRLKDGYWEQLG